HALPRLRVYLARYFFFSSRRRHTRSKRDWSSDVCSSDLHRAQRLRLAAAVGLLVVGVLDREVADGHVVGEDGEGRRAGAPELARSEERRVGKEDTSRR